MRRIKAKEQKQSQERNKENSRIYIVFKRRNAESEIKSSLMDYMLLSHVEVTHLVDNDI